MKLYYILKNITQRAINAYTYPIVDNTLTSTSTNHSLSANMGKSLKDELDSLTPKVYQAKGYIASGNNGIGGYGIAKVRIVGYLAKIDFSFSIQSAGSAGFVWGLNSILMHQKNANIPSTLTPLDTPCGICTYYTSSGAVNTSLTGYGGTVNVVSGYSQLFGFGRIYNTSGDNGMWGENSIPTGTLIIGTCYGKI